jgi:hypothetical protein
MSALYSNTPHDPLPFFITGPGGTDILFFLVAMVLVLALLGFGALYFTIQAIPDKMASGANKAQLQLVGILGLISLFTMNNAFWIAALLLAAVPISNIVLPVKIRSKERKRVSPYGRGNS